MNNLEATGPLTKDTVTPTLQVSRAGQRISHLLKEQGKGGVGCTPTLAPEPALPVGFHETVGQAALGTFPSSM